MPATIYIAETDERNAIASVWVKPKGKSTARVFDPHKHIFDPQEEAQYSGAPEAEIRRWLSRHVVSGAAASGEAIRKE